MEGVDLWVLNKKSFVGQGGGNKRMMFSKNFTRSRRGEEINNKEVQVDNIKFVAHT
jgi:site-specific DNA-adenine methylase